MDNSVLKQKNKKRMVIGIIIILLLGIGFISVAFMKAPNEPEELDVVNNDNIEMGTPSTDEIPDDKLDVKDEFDKIVDTDAKVNKKREDVFKEFENIGQENDTEVVNNGINEFNNDQDKELAKAGYDRAQAQLQRIEDRKRAADRKERERRLEDERREEERKREELRKYQEKSSEDFFGNISGDDGNSSSSSSGRRQQNSIMNNGPTDVRILATVKADQKVKEGERVTLVLEDDYIINGVLYPRNTKVYGIVKFAKNRVKLSIAKINHDVVDMFVEDAQDGLEGIYVRGAALIGEVSGETVDDAIDDINVGTVPVGSTLKSIFKKKRKEVKVQLLNDYHVLLKPNL